MRILLFLAAALLLYFLAYRWMARQSKQQRIQTILVLTGIILIALVATGRASWIFALLGAALPFVRRVMMLLNYLPLVQRLYRQYGGGGGISGSSGQQSRVETRFLRLVLDHDTGEMSGMVLEGDFSGRELADLALEELLQLLTACRVEDEESAQLLEAYLDRVHGSEWREQAEDDTRQKSSGFSDAMSREEALQILGLEEGAGRDEIKDAHRRLMQKLHPDRGGSTFLAWKINQAKSVLLKD